MVRMRVWSARGQPMVRMRVREGLRVVRVR